MRLLTRYLLSRGAVALVVAVLLVGGLIWTLQVLRLAHHLLAGGGVARLLLELLLYSLPSLLGFALPVGLAAALLFSLSQLEETRELEAMRAAGASPLRLARPAMLLCLAAAGLALLAGQLEPPALAALQRTARGAAARALLQGTRPGRFYALPDRTVLYAERRLPHGGPGVRLGGLLLARGPDQLLLARSGTLRVTGQRVSLQLRDGELMLSEAGGQRLTRVQFGSMEHRLELGGALAAQFGFLGGRLTGRGAWAGALGLGLLATLLGLTLRSRLRLALIGSGAVVLYLLLEVAARQLWSAGGPLLLAGITAVGSLGGLGWSGRRS